MFSRSIRTFSIVVLLGLSSSDLFSCIKFGEKSPAANQSPAMGGALFGCLSNFNKTVIDYFSGTATPAAVSGLFDCSKAALTLFLNNTRGETPGGYAPDELRNFLNTYFLGGAGAPLQLSGDFAHSAMVLKQAIFGGTD